MLKRTPISKILVPTPHNCQELRIFEHRNCENKISKGKVFFAIPFTDIHFREGHGTKNGSKTSFMMTEVLVCSTLPNTDTANLSVNHLVD